MKKWLKLIAGIIIIGIFIVYFPVLYQKIPMTKAMYRQIEENGISPDALFYSEETHTATSEDKIKQQLKKK